MTHKKFYSDLKRIVDITKKVICTVGVYLVITLWLAGLYTTFKKVDKGIWEYCGDCFIGENVMPNYTRA